ncbi:MAG: hypothetical protein ACYC6L_05240 [Anaerolineae bacterium]
MNLKQILRIWLPLAALAVALAGLSYILVQQVLRQGANDPQVQLARDTAVDLAGGKLPQDVLPAQIDLGTSLAPFIQVYSQNYVLAAGSALFKGMAPRVPSGVLEAARARGENRITWEPHPGLRIASVVVPVNGGEGGYVLAGRSLAEVEARISNLGILVGLALISILVGTLVAVGAVEWLLGGQ